MKSKPNARWFSKSTDDEDLKKQLAYAIPAFQRLQEIISGEIESLESPKSLDDYDTASWAYKQADRLGQLRAYSNISKLLEFADHVD